MISSILAGLASGGGYALLGLSIVFVYRIARVVNVASSALGAIGAFAMVASANAGCPAVIAVGVGIVAGAAASLMMGAVVVARYEEASESTKIGVAIAVLVGVVTVGGRLTGRVPYRFPEILPSITLPVAGVVVGGSTIAVCATASGLVAQGYSGISLVSRATGVARRTIGAGLIELRQIEDGWTPPWGNARMRKPGAGRKKTTAKDPTLLPDLQALVEATTRGDPASPLLWTARSPRHLVAAWRTQGHQTSMKMVARLFKELGYSLQANRTRLEGAQYPDRNAQFEHINETIRHQLDAGEPVISVDTKKNELVGAYKNGGRELRPYGDPEDVQVHDFVGEAGLLERPNALLYETGGMRRTHLRGHDNILKRLLVHAGACNLGLLMCTLCGVGTPRGLQGRKTTALAAIMALWPW